MQVGRLVYKPSELPTHQFRYACMILVIVKCIICHTCTLQTEYYIIQYV